MLPAECPVCRNTLPWTFVLRPMWSQWRCRGCDSLLEIDSRRRLLLLIPYATVMVIAALLAQRLRMPWLRPEVAIIVAALVAGIPIVLQPPRVRERRGLHCRGCGYDLSGQLVPRCPECGRELSPEELQRLSQRHALVAPRKDAGARRLGIMVVLLIALAVLLALGLWLTASGRVPAVVTRPPTTTSAASP